MNKKILDLIRSARIGHLATASSNLQPYLTPVVFVIEQKSIFIPLDDKPKTTTIKQLKRVKNITENPRVSFLVDHYEEHWKNLWFVMLIGHATLLYQKGKFGNLYIKISIDKTVYWKFRQSSKNGSIYKRNRMISYHIV